MNKDYSYCCSIIDIFPHLFITIYNSSEIYLNDECIGFYYKNSINGEDKSVKYDLSLYDKSVLPENFDFHFEKDNSGRNFKEYFLSGSGIFFNQKMIIDPIFKETEDLNQSSNIADL